MRLIMRTFQEPMRLSVRLIVRGARVQASRLAAWPQRVRVCLGQIQLAAAVNATRAARVGTVDAALHALDDFFHVQPGRAQRDLRMQRQVRCPRVRSVPRGHVAAWLRLLGPKVAVAVGEAREASEAAGRAAGCQHRALPRWSTLQHAGRRLGSAQIWKRALACVLLQASDRALAVRIRTVVNGRVAAGGRAMMRRVERRVGYQTEPGNVS